MTAAKATGTAGIHCRLHLCTHTGHFIILG